MAQKAEDREYLEYIDQIGGLSKLREELKKNNKEALKAWADYVHEVGPSIKNLEGNPDWQVVKEHIILRKKHKTQKYLLEGINLMRDTGVKEALFTKGILYGIDLILNTMDRYHEIYAEFKKGKKAKGRSARKRKG